MRRRKAYPVCLSLSPTTWTFSLTNWILGHLPLPCNSLLGVRLSWEIGQLTSFLAPHLGVFISWAQVKSWSCPLIGWFCCKLSQFWLFPGILLTWTIFFNSIMNVLIVALFSWCSAEFSDLKDPSVLCNIYFTHWETLGLVGCGTVIVVVCAAGWQVSSAICCSKDRGSLSLLQFIPTTLPPQK